MKKELGVALYLFLSFSKVKSDPPPLSLSCNEIGMKSEICSSFL